jgi:hypothetical protein
VQAAGEVSGQVGGGVAGGPAAGVEHEQLRGGKLGWQVAGATGFDPPAGREGGEDCGVGQADVGTGGSGRACGYATACSAGPWVSGLSETSGS